MFVFYPNVLRYAKELHFHHLKGDKVIVGASTFGDVEALKAYIERYVNENGLKCLTVTTETGERVAVVTMMPEPTWTGD